MKKIELSNGQNPTATHQAQLLVFGKWSDINIALVDEQTVLCRSILQLARKIRSGEVQPGEAVETNVGPLRLIECNELEAHVARNSGETVPQVEARLQKEVEAGRITGPLGPASEVNKYADRGGRL